MLYTAFQDPFLKFRRRFYAIKGAYVLIISVTMYCLKGFQVWFTRSIIFSL